MTPSRAVAIVVCFLIALLSKEQGMLFPLMLAILAYARVLPAAASPRELSCNRWLAVSLIWLASAYFFFREHILKFEWNRNWISYAVNPLVRSTGADRWLMPLVLMGRYVAVLVAPYKLSLDYGAGVIGPSVRFHEPYFYLGIAVVIAWLAAFALIFRAGAFRPARHGGPTCTVRCKLARVALFALLGVALNFGMVSNLLALIGTHLGERLAFMPSAFLAVLAGLVVAAMSMTARRWIVSCVLALVAIGSVRTVTYARQWNDAAAFYKAQVAQQPKSVLLHALLYREYARAGNWQSARAVGEDCRRQVPEWWESWLMCFEPEIQMGRLTEAHTLIWQAYRVCYNHALIGWLHRVNAMLAERAQTQPSGPASQPGG
jgi:hypothetical protein